MTSGPVEDAISAALIEALRDCLPAVVEDLGGLAGPRAYSVVEVARRLDVSEYTVRRLIREGRLATVPHLNPTRIGARTLDDFLAAHGNELEATA